MIISIEVPVFKGEFLKQCIQSVFQQSSDAWHLSLVWDGGDGLSRSILEEMDASNYPNVSVYFNENHGIAKSRAFLSAHNNHPYILPLDDDDELAPNAVERFIEAAKDNPWASLIRGKRSFINQQSEHVEETQWFPFGPRNYYQGMVSDVFNQAQPYLIRKSAYDQTQGWQGFDDFMQAGEDCDIFLQLEEVAHFELIDEVLYHYRLHNERASDTLTSAAAFEMWRRLTDKSIERMELPLVRTSETPPFTFESRKRNDFTLDDLDFIVLKGSAVSNQLKQAGIDQKAIIEVVKNEKDASWKMNGFRASDKKLVCFLDNSVQLNDASVFVQLIEKLNVSEADVMAPNTEIKEGIELQNWLDSGCVIVRREVLLATGGFDGENVPNSMHLIDFCIQSNRRGFTCFAAPISGISFNTILGEEWSEQDFEALKTKWHSFPTYLPSMSDLNKLSGEGARR